MDAIFSNLMLGFDVALTPTNIMWVFIGGLLGTVIGYVLARVLCSTVFGRALGLNWLLCVGSLLLSVAIAVIASIPPVRRATRIDPAIVLREE